MLHIRLMHALSQMSGHLMRIVCSTDDARNTRSKRKTIALNVRDLATTKGDLASGAAAVTGANAKPTMNLSASTPKMQTVPTASDICRCAAHHLLISPHCQIISISPVLICLASLCNSRLWHTVIRRADGPAPEERMCFLSVHLGHICATPRRAEAVATARNTCDMPHEHVQ